MRVRRVPVTGARGADGDNEPDGEPPPSLDGLLRGRSSLVGKRGGEPSPSEGNGAGSRMSRKVEGEGSTSDRVRRSAVRRGMREGVGEGVAAMMSKRRGGVTRGTRWKAAGEGGLAVCVSNSVVRVFPIVDFASFPSP